MLFLASCSQVHLCLQVHEKVCTYAPEEEKAKAKLAHACKYAPLCTYTAAEKQDTKVSVQVVFRTFYQDADANYFSLAGARNNMPTSASSISKLEVSV